MFVLVTYDVSTETSQGKSRLRRVAKACQNYGVRVQNSVFECVVSNVELMELKEKIKSIINTDTDSIRYYNIGKNGRSKVEHVGAKAAIDVEDVLIL